LIARLLTPAGVLETVDAKLRRAFFASQYFFLEFIAHPFVFSRVADSFVVIVSFLYFFEFSGFRQLNVRVLFFLVSTRHADVVLVEPTHSKLAHFGITPCALRNGAEIGVH
jgi:hypothetical protein